MLGAGVVILAVGLISLFVGPILSMPPIRMNIPVVQIDIEASTAFGMIVLGAAIAVIPVSVLVIAGGAEVIEMIGLAHDEKIERRYSLLKGWRYFLRVIAGRP